MPIPKRLISARERLTKKMDLISSEIDTVKGEISNLNKNPVKWKMNDLPKWEGRLTSLKKLRKSKQIELQDNERKIKEYEDKIKTEREYKNVPNSKNKEDSVRDESAVTPKRGRGRPPKKTNEIDFGEKIEALEESMRKLISEVRAIRLQISKTNRSLPKKISRNSK